MPHIVIKLFPGRTEEQKVELTNTIVKEATRILAKGEDAFSVDIVEVDSNVWGEEVYKPEILPRMDELYKKPGYKM